MNDLIQRYYDESAATEWARLERYRTEYALTRRALHEYLPPTPARLLDCGGGPGRYAIDLARQGYAVTLFDLSPISLAFARTQAHAAQAQLEGIEQGTATDLARFPDSTFDAVLLLGPLYHLTRAEDRAAALREAHRVLRPGGMLAAAFITPYAFLRFLLKERPEQLSQRAVELKTFFETGVLPAPRQDGTEFIAHVAAPAEVGPRVEPAGFDVRALLGVEG